MAVEWEEFLGSMEASRNWLISESARLSQALWDGSQGIADDLDMHANHVSEWLDKRLMSEEHAMKSFLHGYHGYLNVHPYQPRGYYQRGYGCPRGNGYAVIRGCGIGGGYGHGYNQGYSGYGNGFGYGPSPIKAIALLSALKESYV